MSFEETYTGESVSTSTDIEAKLFNKVVQNARVARDRLRFHGARISFDSDDARNTTRFNEVDDYTDTGFELPLEKIEYDSGGFFFSDQPGRIYIPEGFSYAEAFASADFLVGNWELQIKLNGVTIKGRSRISNRSNSNNSYTRISTQTAINSVTPGDYFSAFFVKEAASPGSVSMKQTMDSVTYGGSLVQSISDDSDFILEVRAYK